MRIFYILKVLCGTASGQLVRLLVNSINPRPTLASRLLPALTVNMETEGASVIAMHSALE